MHRYYKQLMILMGSILLASGCADEQPPRSVNQFVEDPIMLEASMVRCAENRQETRYDTECINARQAVSLIEAKEEALHRAEFESRSDAKRQALRRAQTAAAEARRRAAEAEKQRRENEYLAQFGVAMPADTPAPDGANISGNTPLAVIPNNEGRDNTTTEKFSTSAATDGGNAPASSAEPDQESPPTDLASIRDELQRRNEEGGDQP